MHYSQKCYRKNYLLRYVLLTLCLFLWNSVAWGQLLDNKGTDFIMAFIRNPNVLEGNLLEIILFDPKVELHLTHDKETDIMVTVEYPLNTILENIIVEPGSVKIVSLPLEASRSWIADNISYNAVRAFSEDEFVIYMVNRLSFSSDAALALPVDSMNTDYIVTDYNPVKEFEHTEVGSQFIVYAAFDNTTVTIKPAQNIVGHSAGDPFEVILNRGEGYYARSSTTNPTNTLTGTIISADKPIGLTNGNGCAEVPFSKVPCDHIFEVAQPVQTWGNEILVANLPNRPNGSIYRIVASEDGTTVTQDGEAVVTKDEDTNFNGILDPGEDPNGNGVIDVVDVCETLNRGEFCETIIISGNHIFAGDKPIFVTQYMTGQSNTGAILGDPSMGNMVPSAQYRSEYTFSTVGGGQFTENFLTVIAEDSDVANGTILLDGNPIPATEFTSISDSGFSAALVPLSEGTHNTSSNGVHGITVEGYNTADSYIYPGGTLLQFINPAGDMNLPICNIQAVDTNPPSAIGTAEDNQPSEDTNDNGILDPGEDLNNNGMIDEDTGVFFVELESGADNLTLIVDPFDPGVKSVSFTALQTEMGIPGSGVVRVTDGAGNFSTCDITLGDTNPPTCNIEVFNGDTGTVTGTAEDNSSPQDTGVCSVELEQAENLDLTVSGSLPADNVSFTVSLINPNESGSGVVRVTDCEGNVSQNPCNITLEGVPSVNTCKKKHKWAKKHDDGKSAHRRHKRDKKHEDSKYSCREYKRHKSNDDDNKSVHRRHKRYKKHEDSKSVHQEYKRTKNHEDGESTHQGHKRHRNHGDSKSAHLECKK